MEPSELRKGYAHIQEWIDAGMKPSANIAFTEGDSRLAAQLVEYAMTRSKDAAMQEWKARKVLIMSLRERLAFEEKVQADLELRLKS